MFFSIFRVMLFSTDFGLGCSSLSATCWNWWHYRTSEYWTWL